MKGYGDEKMDKYIERVKAVVFGHAVADALGVPVEFKSRRELSENQVTDMLGYGTHPVPEGTWSDDTSMALATMDSLLHGVGYRDMMYRFSLWKDHAEYTATGEVFDMGIGTRRAIVRFQNGEAAEQCGGDTEYDNGNGALMRIYPIVLMHYLNSNSPDEYEFAEIIRRTAALTHAHERSHVGCIIYSYALLQVLRNQNVEAIMTGIMEAFRLCSDSKELKHYKRLTQTDFPKLPEEEINSSGYVVSTLEAAIWCVINTKSYQECILKAVNLGEDTDTVAAVAGSIAGALYGFEEIPKKWYNKLKRKEYIEELCYRLTDKFTMGGNILVR